MRPAIESSNQPSCPGKTHKTCLFVVVALSMFEHVLEQNALVDFIVSGQTEEQLGRAKPSLTQSERLTHRC
eukprot:1922638-Amphidinium_carterae.1